MSQFSSASPIAPWWFEGIHNERHSRSEYYFIILEMILKNILLSTFYFLNLCESCDNHLGIEKTKHKPCHKRCRLCECDSVLESNLTPSTAGGRGWKEEGGWKERGENGG